MTKDDILNRMKAAQAEDANADHVAGKIAGRSWAETKASPKQLARLADAMEEEGDDIPASLDGWEEVVGGPAACLVQIIKGHMDHSGGIEPGQDPEEAGRAFNLEVMEFWRDILGHASSERIEDHDFAQGFIEGALAVWNEVKDNL